MRLFFLFLITLPVISYSQLSTETYNIKNPGNDFYKQCGEYELIFRKLPFDVRYSVNLEGNRIFFYFRSREHFDQIFNDKSDGIAIDIVWRDQYRCLMKDRFPNSWASRGYLMPPVYREELIKNMTGQAYQGVYIYLGTVPEQFDLKDIELNLMIIQKKYKCAYHYFSNIDFTNWDILEMGLYRDTLQTGKGNSFTEVSKTLDFVVPFEKNRSEYNPDDIRPLYDSLNLTHYNIKEMSIRAYSSVEGTEEKNIQLHQARAESIVKALQHYQTPEIAFQVKASENWVELLSDIQGTRFEYLEQLSKEEVKEELRKNEVLAGIEPILKNHRKAIIRLKLQKKFSEEENDPKLLKTYFDQSIESRNIEEALYLQEVIFEKVKDEKIPEEFIGKLEIPEESFFGPLLNNRQIYYYEGTDNIYETILNYESLARLMPGNYKIKYNLLALKLKAWTKNQLIATGPELQKDIDELSQSDIDPSLIRRLNVNYNIIMTDYYDLNGEYNRKNSTLLKVYKLYSSLNLNDRDNLHLAKYLSYYSRFDWAEKILLPKVTDVNTDEDLLFYYLRLTIAESRNTKSTTYRAIMLNAIDKNQQRFCDLFQSTNKGGYTFQLLGNKYLKSTYCENCRARR